MNTIEESNMRLKAKKITLGVDNLKTLSNSTVPTPFMPLNCTYCMKALIRNGPAGGLQFQSRHPAGKRGLQASSMAHSCLYVPLRKVSMIVDTGVCRTHPLHGLPCPSEYCLSEVNWVA